jgi:hypothetical protein
MAIRGRATGAAAAAVFAVITASGGCVQMVHTGNRVGPGSNLGSDVGTLGVGGDAIFKRAATYPNLTLFAAGPGKTRISVAPCSPSTGSEGITSDDRICADMAVQNNGYGPTDGATEILISLDGSPLEIWVIPAAIRPGDVVDRRPVSFGPLAPGPHVLRVVIDPDNKIAETSEADNDDDAPFFVSPRTPDTEDARPRSQA